MDMHQGAEPPSRQERSPRRSARPVRLRATPAPPPLRLAGALAIAYWNTRGPVTGPSARRPLGALA